MSMTRKHYEVIASAIRDEMEVLMEEKMNGLDRGHHMVGVSLVARRIANRLGDDNPRLDRDKFLNACGID